MDEETTRLYLQAKLEELFPALGVFFEPPGNVPIPRPCVIYTQLQEEPVYANNLAYVVGVRYQLTFLSDRPGLTGIRAIFDANDITTSNNRRYIQNDIVHHVFTVSVNSI